MTCQHKPFLANNDQVSQAWDSCMGPGLNTTIDAGETLLQLLSQEKPSLALVEKSDCALLPSDDSACDATGCLQQAQG